jgi:outer membrane biosynthesis protein TonB
VELFDLLYEDTTVGRLGAPSKPAAPLLFDQPTGHSMGDGHRSHDAHASEHPQGPRALSMLSDEPTAGLGDVPTGLPANRRVAVPTGLRNNRPQVPAEVALEARGRGLGWLVAVAGPMLLVVGVAMGVGVALLTRDDATEVRPVAPPTVGELATAPPAPVAPVPVEVEPAPAPVEPVPAKPAPVKPAPVKPAPVVKPDPAPVRPTPAPAAPDPEPQVIRIERTQPTTAVVRITGDAQSVWLVADGRRYDPAQPLQAGSYRILADFGGDAPVQAGSVDLTGGEQVELACSSYAYRCTVR